MVSPPTSSRARAAAPLTAWPVARRWSLRARATAPALLPLALAACGGNGDAAPGATEPLALGTYAGAYMVTRLNQEAACAPTTVPAPVRDGGGPWVSFSPAGSSDALRLRVRHAGAQLIVVEVDGAGRETDNWFAGGIAEDGTFSAGRTSGPRLLEGVRMGPTGAVSVSVTERLAVSGTFARSSGGQARLDLTAAQTYDFASALSDGFGDYYRSQPFTTCVQRFTAAGVRGGP
jgi:hypothetical protein